MKVARILVFLIPLTVAKHHHSSPHNSVLESKDNFFHNVNEAIHTVMNNLFDSIDLPTNFTNGSNTKLLLIMHYDLSNIANKYFNALNDIQNITKGDVINQTQEMIALDAIVDNVLNENHFDVFNIVKGEHHRHRHTKDKSRSRSKRFNIISDFENSEEFTDFVIGFLAKVNNITIKDFKRSSKHGGITISSRRNLKVWEPPSSIELDSVNATNTRRVYRGTKTHIKKYPFIVSIHIMGEFACAGCIISRDLIITAASCLQVAYKNEFFKANPKSIYVRLGSAFTLRYGETIPVEKLYFHPNYNTEYLRHNLAIIRLEKRIRFSRQQKRIRRIVWDKSPRNLTTATKGILILGWGATRSDQRVKKHQKLTVDMLGVYNTDDCKAMYTEEYVNEDNFCAGFTKNSGGACNRDVGGPGIVNAVLVGIISFGAPICGSADMPTVFTKLGYYVPWIESIMNPRDRARQAIDQVKSRRIINSTDVFHLNISTFEHNNGNNDNKNNNTVLDILNGDLNKEFNKTIKSTEKENILPLENKDNFLLPDEDVLPTQTPTNITSINKESTTSILRKMSDTEDETEDETDDDNAKINDYTDNYDKSTEDESEVNMRHQQIITSSTTTLNNTQTRQAKVLIER